MISFKPPSKPLPFAKNTKTVFLAGSIDMGKAIDWQTYITDELSDITGVIFNPRRDDWDSSWEQDISNREFRDQVNWELDRLSEASVIAFFFDPNGKAPITLMELGLHAASGKCVVVCPEGYWKRGNVQVICKRFDIPLKDNLDDLVDIIRSRLSPKQW